MSGSGGASPAEQHLGDRLAALVDGELGHDARERVLAHLATCGKCKAEADAQRRLKSVFARTAPPGPSEGLLARLQGLPGGEPDGPGGRLGERGFGRAEFGRSGGSFGYLPSGGGRARDGVPQQPRPAGFPIHDTVRPAPPRRRFAFAAAGAVSLAAIALGGALPLEAALDTPGRQEGGGATVTPLSATPVAGTDALIRDNGFLTGRSAPYGPSAPAPAPSAMSLYGPSAPASPPLRAPADGRTGLSALLAPAGQSADRYPLPPAIGAYHLPRAHTPQPPQPEGPLTRAVGPAAPAGHGPAAAGR